MIATKFTNIPHHGVIREPTRKCHLGHVKEEKTAGMKEI